MWSLMGEMMGETGVVATAVRNSQWLSVCWHRGHACGEPLAWLVVSWTTGRQRTGDRPFHYHNGGAADPAFARDLAAALTAAAETSERLERGEVTPAALFAEHASPLR